MAKIVLGIATSHGPQLNTSPEKWALRLAFDRGAKHPFRGGEYSFDELARMRADERLELQIAPDVLAAKHKRCRDAIEELARVYEAAAPDVAVIFGNDQMEVFTGDLIPAFTVHYGPTVENIPPDAARIAKMPPGIAEFVAGTAPSHAATYDGCPELGRQLLQSAIMDGFDVAAMAKWPSRPDRPGSAPHAYGFVYRQIMKDKVIPHVPVVINTFYPPNQPTVRRCFDLGRSVMGAIEAWEGDARVAVFASGGLSHFAIDENLDRLVLDCMSTGDVTPLERLGDNVFQAGTSEIKNWIPVAGVMAALKKPMTVVDYVPCYRSEAGTGTAMGFVHWQ